MLYRCYKLTTNGHQNVIRAALTKARWKNERWKLGKYLIIVPEGMRNKEVTSLPYTRKNVAIVSSDF